MAWDNIPRTHSFSLGDFHDFDRCSFRFFVNHHLGKKYELAEGNENMTIGSLLDLAIKKLHKSGAYDQPISYLVNLIKAAELEMREDVAGKGLNSFYGAQIEFLTPEVLQRAAQVFTKYHQGLNGKHKKMVPTTIMKRNKPFWKQAMEGSALFQLWGGPDAIEEGEDGIPEIVDYKYMENSEVGKKGLDMDLMPKIYTLLCADDLKEMGFSKARFVVRFWQEPGENSFYEEFDLEAMDPLKEFFKDKIERILRTEELQFCNKDYCRVCSSSQKDEWIKELKSKGWIKGDDMDSVLEASPDLPF